MKHLHALLAICLLAPAFSGAAAAEPDPGFLKYTNYNPDLPEHTLSEKDFLAPSGFARPQTWWHWLNGHVSKEGIEADLREMADKGYGHARVFSVGNKEKQAAPVPFASPAWFDAFGFAVRTAEKYNLGIGIHNCDGWSEAGGPWVSPEQSMKELTFKTLRLAGDGTEQSVALPALDRRLDFARDIAVLAWPARRPALLAMHRPGAVRRVFPAGAAAKAEGAPDGFTPGGRALAVESAAFDGNPVARMFDGRTGGDRAVFSRPSGGGGAAGFTIEFAAPFEAAGAFVDTVFYSPLNIVLECSDDGENFGRVCDFSFRQSGSATARFAPRKARFWRLLRLPAPGGRDAARLREDRLQVGEFELLAPGEQPRAPSPVTRFASMAGAASDRGPGPEDAPPSAEVPPGRILRPGEVRDLTALVTAADNAGPATLRWRVPDGDWVVMRAGYTTTGKNVSPATEAGRGLEVDKFEAAHVNHHFDSYPKKMIEAAGPLAGKTFNVIETDSWEAGHQNWTQNFERYFREHNGYDILPWLPLYAGECVESLAATENFLRDLRDTFATLIARNFFENMAARARASGMLYETEECLESFARSPNDAYRAADIPMTTVWQPPRDPFSVPGIRPPEAFTGPYGGHDPREPASVAHFYGKRYVSSESLTSTKGNWAQTPWTLKGTLDACLFAGANLNVFHTYSHQPDERAPGWQMNPWGAALNRKLTWWPLSKPWFAYVARVQYMLQQGRAAVPLLYFYTDQVPSGNAVLPLQSGIPYDVADGDAVRNFLRVENGRLVSPGRMAYALMVISPKTALRLETLEKLKALLHAGAVVSAERKPAFNPSLRGGAAAGARWRALAGELFGDGSRAARKIGAGTLYTGHTPDEAAAAAGLRAAFQARLENGATAADIAWLHRGHADGTEWFWVANRDPATPRSGLMSFAVTGKTASLWHPETGKITPAPAAAEHDGRTVLPLALERLEGVFVVFSKKPAAAAATAAATAVKITGPDGAIFPAPAADATAAGAAPAAGPGDFTFAVTVSPAASRRLTKAAASGILPGATRGDGENFVITPAPEHRARPGKNLHAGAGLSVGTNSVAVFEHGASYINSIITWDHPVAPGTRVAVVYKDSRPSLYINGKLAAAAAPSGRVVLPPAGVAAGFKGAATGFTVKNTALSEAGLAALAARPEAPAGLPPARLLIDGNGALAAEFALPGKLEIETASGRRLVLAAADVPAPRAVPGPFAVAFDSKWGAPAGPCDFDRLVSWTERAEPGIRHYSGIAVYAKQLEFPDAPGAGARVYLHIDRVCEVAEVSLNGRVAGTLWRPPHRLDITDYIKKGVNTLSIKVANTWVNRCLHDATLPESERLTWANTMYLHYPDPKTIKPGDSVPWAHGPLPSGLIGEMRLVYTKIVAAPR
jgi:hypothetical protein